MAINVSVANNQANQLNDNVSKLYDAKKQMQGYRASVYNNWQGKEVTYILEAIDKVIGDIDSAIRNIESLSSDIKSVAAQIKREEDEAAARAAAEQRAAEQRAAEQRSAAGRNAASNAAVAQPTQASSAKQQKINAAQNAYDNAKNELDKLMDQKNKLEKKIQKANLIKKLSLWDDLRALEKAINAAEDNVKKAQNALKAAKK